jgi:hypothetical protein
MSVRSARWLKDRGMILAISCDICSAQGEGTMEEIEDAGWHLESVAITPHVCPDCVPALMRDLGRAPA